MTAPLIFAASVATLGLLAASLPPVRTRHGAYLEAGVASAALGLLSAPFSPVDPRSGLAALSALLLLRLVSATERASATPVSGGRHLLALLAMTVASQVLFSSTRRASGLPAGVTAIAPFVIAYLALQPSRVSLRAAVCFALLPLLVLAFAHA